MNPTETIAAIITREDQCLTLIGTTPDERSLPRYPFTPGVSPESILEDGVRRDFGLSVRIQYRFRTVTDSQGKTDFYVCTLSEDQPATGSMPPRTAWLAAYELDLFDWPAEENSFLVFLRNFLSSDMF